MKAVFISISLFLLFSFAKPKESVYGQSTDLLEQINSFNDEKIILIIKDINEVIDSKDPKVVLARELCQDLREKKKKCVLGYVNSSRLIKKLASNEKPEYINDVKEVGMLFRRLHKHYNDMLYYTSRMEKNPESYKTRTIAILNKKMNMIKGVQSRLQAKTAKLAEINAWEKKFAPSNIIMNN